ncbi:SDR family NAD(P)-dependent oxidoreductase [Yinghuangia aomiensis]
MYDLTGKTVLVTGAAQGQGAAEARLFAACGANVVLTDVQAELGAQVAAEIGGKARFVALDVSDEKAWEAAVAFAVDTFGALDALVNNAAAMRIVPIADETADGFRRILDINLTGTFLGIRAAAPAMRANGGGSIVNVASVSGLQGQAWASAYSASKWGIRGLTRTAAIELGPDGIRVNTPCRASSRPRCCRRTAAAPSATPASTGCRSAAPERPTRSRTWRRSWSPRRVLRHRRRLPRRRRPHRRPAGRTAPGRADAVPLSRRRPTVRSPKDHPPRHRTVGRPGAGALSGTRRPPATGRREAPKNRA